MTESEVWIVLWFLIVPFSFIYLYYLIKVILSPFFWISDKKHEAKESFNQAKQETPEVVESDYVEKVKELKVQKIANKQSSLSANKQSNNTVLKEPKIENLKHFLKEEEAQDKAYFLKLYFSLSYTGRKELLRNDEFFRNIAGKPHLQKLIQKIDNDKEKIPIEEFFELRSKIMSENRKNKESHLSWQYSGVYILHNETTDKYYVGQSVNMFRRLRDHFTGYGNHRVYSTYQNGDKWFIKTVLLRETDFPSLNVLERSAIYYYNSCENGYNISLGEFI